MFTSGAHACWSTRALKVEGYATSLSWTSLSLAYVTWQKCCVYVTWQGTHVRTCMHDVHQRLSDYRTCTCMCGQMQEVIDDKDEFRLFLHRAIPSAMKNVAWRCASCKLGDRVINRYTATSEQVLFLKTTWQQQPMLPGQKLFLRAWPRGIHS